MKIDGKAIAEKILQDLARQVTELKEKGITPTLGVILVGDDPASLSYIKQKQKTAEAIGAKVIVNQIATTTTTEELKKIIDILNADPTIHGIIVQRPLPKESSVHRDVLNEISPKKDVDGFVPNSPYGVPVAKAVLTILREVFAQELKNVQAQTFEDWLKNQCVAVIGRGETAGKPIADALGEHGCTLSVVHSKTEHPEQIIKTLNIVVSCVGKERVVTKEMIAPGTILISVGIWRDTFGKLHGDYEEEEIQDVASYYTPTPGGVGPVNVACLMQNLIKACTINI